MPRPANSIDLMNHTFGTLLVMEPASPRTWRCVCRCGKVVEVLTANLRMNRRSCDRYCPDKVRGLKQQYIARVKDQSKLSGLSRSCTTVIMNEYGDGIQGLSEAERAEFLERMNYNINVLCGHYPKEKKWTT